jgi:hypothetical protein
MGIVKSPEKTANGPLRSLYWRAAPPGSAHAQRASDFASAWLHRSEGSLIFADARLAHGGLIDHLPARILGKIPGPFARL